MPFFGLVCAVRYTISYSPLKDPVKMGKMKDAKIKRTRRRTSPENQEYNDYDIISMSIVSNFSILHVLFT